MSPQEASAVRRIVGDAVFAGFPVGIVVAADGAEARGERLEIGESEGIRPEAGLSKRHARPSQTIADCKLVRRSLGEGGFRIADTAEREHAREREGLLAVDFGCGRKAALVIWACKNLSPIIRDISEPSRKGKKPGLLKVRVGTPGRDYSVAFAEITAGEGRTQPPRYGEQGPLRGCRAGQSE